MQSIGLGIAPFMAHLATDPLGYQLWYRADFSIFELILGADLAILALFVRGEGGLGRIAAVVLGVIAILASGVVYGTLASSSPLNIDKHGPREVDPKVVLYTNIYDRYATAAIVFTILGQLCFSFPKLVAESKIVERSVYTL